jgi:hypothetical protein
VAGIKEGEDGKRKRGEMKQKNSLHMKRLGGGGREEKSRGRKEEYMWTRVGRREWR